MSFNAGGVLTSAVYYNNDGSTTTDKYTSTGALTQHTLLNADGSRDIYDYGVKGIGYVADHRVYNAGGTLTQFVAINADGSKVVDDYVVTSKSYKSDHLGYSADGRLTSAIYYNNDGSTTTDKYGSTGALTQHNVVHADGSREVFDYGVTGQSYVADERVYNAAGTLTEFVAIAADGSEKITASAANLLLTGGTGNDTFYGFANDTFAFKGNFGNDKVNYFHAGAVAKHDVIEFDAQAVADFSHLAMAQRGGDDDIRSRATARSRSLA